MRSIEDRTFKMEDIPDYALPSEEQMNRVIYGIMKLLGESPEALRGFMHGLDMAIGFTSYAIEESVDIAWSEGLTPEAMGVHPDDPAFTSLTKMMQLVGTLERSREYAAAVGFGRRHGQRMGFQGDSGTGDRN